MILKEALNFTKQTLFKSEIPDAFSEAELLLCHTVNFSRTQLYTYPEKELEEEAFTLLNQLIQRRIQNEPTAYILQHCGFYNSTFYVDHRVLIPRPETELLVEKTIDFVTTHFPTNRKFMIADIGTGSGAIATSLALALPNATIYATDISKQALQVACQNFHCHNIHHHIIPLQGNLLSPLPEMVDVIVANLPYVARNDIAELAPEINRFEPLIALDGGQDGMDKIQSLLYQSPGKIHTDGCILLEIGQNQDKSLLPLIHHLFPKASIEVTADLSGINRVLKINGGIGSLSQVSVCNQADCNTKLTIS